MTGIVSYGIYIPKYRILPEEISRAWNKLSGVGQRAGSGVGKSVPATDEDAVTIAVEAARQSLAVYEGNPTDLSALFVGSESHPYAVNPTSTIVGEMLGMGNAYVASDTQFACKAGTAGMQAVLGLVESGRIAQGMAIGADTAQSKPHDALEYTSAAAGAAFIIGKNQVVASIDACVSFSSDTPDFWRRDGASYPSHAGRFTGEPAYFTHVMGAADLLFAKTNIKPSDVTHCVFHMPNGKFPRAVAGRLGFTPQQLAPSLIVDLIGNPYSASSMVGLAAVLDEAKAGDKIFLVSYGSGAGSDGFLLTVTKNIGIIQQMRKKARLLFSDIVKHTVSLSYVDYLRFTHKI